MSAVSTPGRITDPAPAKSPGSRGRIRPLPVSVKPLTRFLPLAALCVSFLCASLPAADLHYLRPGQPDTVALLAPPPLPDSPEQASDLAAVIKAHKNSSASDQTMAKSEKRVHIFSFAPAIGDFFQTNKLPKTEALFHRIHDDINGVIDAGKDFWKRPRPYLVEPSLAKGEQENSFSYPSGHSTHATVYALLLAELVPDKRDDILAIGRSIGWRRVQIGRHYPTDIHAGRVLAQAIVRELKASPAFQLDFAEARAEIQAARQKP